MLKKHHTEQAQRIAEIVDRAYAELQEINKKIIDISNSLREEKIKEGLIYLKLSVKNGTSYPLWAVLLFSNTNGKPFSKSLGTKLTKKSVRAAHNGRRMQKLIPASKKVTELISRRRKITDTLKSLHMKLGALYPKAKLKKGSVSFI